VSRKQTQEKAEIVSNYRKPRNTWTTTIRGIRLLTQYDKHIVLISNIHIILHYSVRLHSNTAV